MTPLVDIVLVLLVIFIVTAKFVVAPAVPLDLPLASKSEEVQTVFAVTLTEDGDLLIDGEQTSMNQLTERAEAALLRDKNLRAVIQADGDARHRQVIGVLDALREAQVERVAFATAQGGDREVGKKPPEKP